MIDDVLEPEMQNDDKYKSMRFSGTTQADTPNQTLIGKRLSLTSTNRNSPVINFNENIKTQEIEEDI